MNDIKHTEELLRWASGGALSACLAFIVFIPALENVDSYFQDISIMSFIVAIPFLSISLARYKENEIKGAKEKSDPGAYVSSSVAGFLFVIAGFAMLLAAIKIMYLFTFLIALIFMLVFETRRRRDKDDV